MLWLPKWLRDEASTEEPTPGVTRRGFLFMSGVIVGGAMIPASLETIIAPTQQVTSHVGGFDLQSANEILKKLYLPVIREQLDNQTMLFKYIKREVPEIGENEFTVPLHVDRNITRYEDMLRRIKADAV